MVAKVKKRMGFFQSIVQFFRDLKAETKRITWPSKEDFKKATLAVIVFCLIWIAIIFVMDIGFKYLFKIIIPK